MYKPRNGKKPAKNSLTWEDKNTMEYAQNFQREVRSLHEEIKKAKRMIGEPVS